MCVKMLKGGVLGGIVVSVINVVCEVVVDLVLCCELFDFYLLCL